jgi:3-oxochol-4-en-24-oyl-CoA dehydrogenase
MAIALTEERRELGSVARAFLSDRKALGAARALLDSSAEGLPAFWSELCSLGWPGLHLPESVGGSGYGLLEVATIVEELGRVCAPGPFLPTITASAVIDAVGSAQQKAAHLPGLANGSVIGAVGYGGVGGSGSLTLSQGRLSGRVAVVAGGLADLFLLCVGDDAVLVPAASVKVSPTKGLDLTRRIAMVEVEDLKVDADAIVAGGARVALTIGRALAAAEAAGGAAACVEMAVEYAKVREQFGRTISYFQAVKHHCANMLVDAELAAAGAWDAARAGGVGAAASLTAAFAATEALPAFRRCAEKNIQILGGIGFTWEHDAHLYLRRATVLAAVFGADHDAPLDAAALVASGIETNESVELPPEAERYRADARAFGERYRGLTKRPAQIDALIESGYYMPHWPKPFGRGAGAVEQLVIDEELPDVDRPSLGIGSWVLLTLLQHATPDQIERWIVPSLREEQRWCQLFSEPNAGSDAAAIQTKATRVEGGWLVNGQKVWTSDAMNCNRGLATVRTDPEASKHAGVSTFAMDMKAKGVEVRPLREITGEALFNEVFFDDVFVPDDDVVGPLNQGWTVARATLGNERVSIGGNRGKLDQTSGAELIELADRYAGGETAARVEAAQVAAEEHAMVALNLRNVMRAIVGGPPGPEGAITKLLSAEHQQRASGLAVRLAGMAAVAGDDERLSHLFLFAKCLTIAGGTSEIVRNIIAERILGLPRDPLAK